MSGERPSYYEDMRAKMDGRKNALKIKRGGHHKGGRRGLPWR